MPPEPTLETAEIPAEYPQEWEADVVLRDGSVTHVRPILPSDGEGIRSFHSKQSAESIYLRFFAPLRELSDRDVHRFTHVDYDERVALVATHRGEIIGIGRYDKITPTSAEVAFNISDHHQGKGIGSVMLEHLATIALDRDIEKFTAEVLPQNRKMLNVFKEAGYAVTHHLEEGVVAVEFEIKPTEQSKAVRLAREHRAESVSIRQLLFPKAIAVIGASRRRDSIGHQFLRNILQHDFEGGVFAVNNEALEVQGMRSFARVSEIPSEIDLAIIAVPAQEVLDVVSDCTEAGVQSIIVVSAGFAEAGEEGVALQQELRERARFGGMRVLGPASFGIVNNHPDANLNATLVPRAPRPGRLGLFSQSHALGISLLSGGDRRNLGTSVFISAGNRVDISGNDCMQWFIDDESTDVVGLYLESIGNPRKFSRIARELAKTKPLVAVAAAGSAFGVPPGHRVRKTELPPEALEAMLKQAGVIRVDNAHQFFDVVQLALHQPLPKGNRVAIVGNSTSLGALTAQIAKTYALDVVHGPIALAAEATAEDFAKALRVAFADPDVDSVIACFIPPLVTADEDVTSAVREVAKDYEKPCVATFLGMREIVEGITPEETGQRTALPVYPLPEYSVRALGTVTAYALWRERDAGSPMRIDGIDKDAAEQFLEEILHANPEGRVLVPEECRQLLGTYGIELKPWREVATAHEAEAAAIELGYPVIVKSRSPMLRDRPELAGVRRHIHDAAELYEACESLRRDGGAYADDGFIVQTMVDPGVSCVLGTREDPLFGPVIEFSIAGPPTDLLGDISYGIPPLTDVDVRQLICAPKAAPLLTGHRGAEPADLNALADVVSRLSILADDNPELARIRLLPLLARPDGVDVLGAEITVRRPPQRQDSDRRAMTGT